MLSIAFELKRFIDEIHYKLILMRMPVIFIGLYENTRFIMVISSTRKYEMIYLFSNLNSLDEFNNLNQLICLESVEKAFSNR